MDKFSTKSLNILFIITLAFVGIFYVSFVNNTPILQEDAAAYISLAKSLVEGKGYTTTWYETPLPHTMFPPTYPFILSIPIKLFGLNYFALKLMTVALSLVSFILVFVLFKKLSGIKTSYLIFLLTAINYNVINYGTSIMREIPFMFFSLLSVLLLFKFTKNKHSTLLQALGIGLILGITTLTRQVGISLILSFIIFITHSLLTKNKANIQIKHSISLLLASIIPIAIWTMRKKFAIGTINYSNTFFLINDPFHPEIAFTYSGFFMRIIKGAYSCVFYSIPEILVNYRFSNRTIIAFLISFPFFYNLIKNLLKKRGLIDVFLLFYLCILFAWPWTQTTGWRFLAPITPFIYFYFINGVLSISQDWIVHKTTRTFFALSILCIFVSFNTFQFANKYVFIKPLTVQESEMSLAHDSFYSMEKWIIKNIPRDAIIMSSLPQSLYLHTSHKAPRMVRIMMTKDSLLEIIRKKNVDYLLYDNIMKITKKNVSPMIQENPELFTLLHKERKTLIYKINIKE